MIAAIGLGIAFLVLYLSYHFGAGLAKFGGEGLIRPVYFTILIAHIIAATVAVPLVPLAVYRAVTGKYERHRRLAPWAWKVWMFVALSGIVVYAMTIHIWPYKGA
jgi:putative membrane protein